MRTRILFEREGTARRIIEYISKNRITFLKNNDDSELKNQSDFIKWRKEELLKKHNAKTGFDELKAKYDVKSPDMNHTCLIIAIDILQMSMFSEEEENFDDDDEWIDESDEDKTE